MKTMKVGMTLSILAAVVMAGAVRCLAGDNAPSRPRHVIIVGYDGCGSLYVTPDLKLPNLRRLMSEGAWTFNKRSALPSSTCINWTSIFTAAGPEQHGFRGSDQRDPSFPPILTMENGHFPDVFALFRKTNPSAKIGYVCEWGGMMHLIDTNACDFARSCNTPAEVGIPFLEKEKPQLMMFYFEEPDGTGHKKGWGGPEYSRMLETLDEKLGDILKAVERAGIADDTVIIVTSDHGGHDKGHGTTINADMQSPLVIWGKGVRKNYELKSSIYSYDIGATVADLLGVRLPQVCIGRSVKEAFVEGGCACDKPVAAPHPGHVVFIGIGCLGTVYITDPKKLPNINRLMMEGTWTMKKQSVLLPWMCVTSPVNWSAMFMGAGGEQTGCLQHGFTSPYSDDPRGFKPNGMLENGRFPDIYALCHAAEPSAKLGYTYNYKWYDKFVDTNVCDYAVWNNNPLKDGLAYLSREQPRLMSFILGTLERKGIEDGWGGAKYTAALEEFDKSIGEILKAIESSPMAGDTVVIVTSERGGVPKQTSTPVPAEMNTPLLIWGKGIRKGHQLEFVPYSYDIGATMAALLGVKLPQVCTGRVINEAFENK